MRFEVTENQEKCFPKVLKRDSILWYAETKSLTKVQRLYRAKYGYTECTLKGKEIKKWHKNFQEKSVVTPKKVKTKTTNS